MTAFPFHGDSNSMLLKTIRLGTRSSRLALAQANLVRSLLWPQGVACEIVEISTPGDKDLTRSVADFDTAGPFTDDIETALLRGEIDIAVHSLKDLQLTHMPGLCIAAILARGDPRESLVSVENARLDDLPSGAIVGTSCDRRAAQIRYLRNDLRVRSIRGPVDERIRQVREGGFDAVILAIAGLQRSGLGAEAAEIFALSRFVPAPAQAALAIQTRDEDVETNRLVATLDHAITREAVNAELSVLARFDGRDDITIAAIAARSPDLQIRVRVLRTDGHPLFESILAGCDGAALACHAIHRIEEVLQQWKIGL